MSQHSNRQTPIVSFFTLGCKLNHSETDSIATELEQRGFQIMQGIKEEAKYVVINTCTVTSKADRKSRNMINRALRTEGETVAADEIDESPQIFTPSRAFSPVRAKSMTTNTEALLSKHTSSEYISGKAPSDSSAKHKKKRIVIVTGCFVGSGIKELAGMPIDYIVDNSKKKHIPDIIDAHEEGQILDIDALPQDYFGYTSSSNIFHVRNNLKIQDGCDNFCTFCIIPMVRGKAKSRPLQDIVQDARMMLEKGTKEIILTGVNMSRYDHGDYGFSDVLEGILRLPMDFRLRISSLEPDCIDERFFALLSHPQICPHLHLCLQSGSDEILLRMRRMYTTQEFLNCIKKIREHCPDINFTTDLIVGFPGENETHFSQSKEIIRGCEFSHTHIFPYSQRSGTRASRMEQQVDAQTKKQRIKEIEALNLTQKNKYRMKFLGKEQDVLVERIIRKENIYVAQGFSQYYIPVEIKLENIPETEIKKDESQNYSHPQISNQILHIIVENYTTDEKDEILLCARLMAISLNLNNPCERNHLQ